MISITDALQQWGALPPANYDLGEADLKRILLLSNELKTIFEELNVPYLFWFGAGMDESASRGSLSVLIEDFSKAPVELFMASLVLQHGPELAMAGMVQCIEALGARRARFNLGEGLPAPAPDEKMDAATEAAQRLLEQLATMKKGN